MGTPNATRDLACSTAISRDARATPVSAAAIMSSHSRPRRSKARTASGPDARTVRSPGASMRSNHPSAEHASLARRSGGSSTMITTSSSPHSPTTPSAAAADGTSCEHPGRPGRSAGTTILSPASTSPIHGRAPPPPPSARPAPSPPRSSAMLMATGRSAWSSRHRPRSTPLTSAARTVSGGHRSSSSAANVSESICWMSFNRKSACRSVVVRHDTADRPAHSCGTPSAKCVTVFQVGTTTGLIAEARPISLSDPGSPERRCSTDDARRRSLVRVWSAT